jgi:hypothetical protein
LNLEDNHSNNKSDFRRAVRCLTVHRRDDAERQTEMKRWLIATMALLASSLSTAQAQPANPHPGYMIIRVYINGQSDLQPTSNRGGGALGQRGQGGGAPVAGQFGGGFMGQPPIGALGIGGQPPMGFMGAIGQPPKGAFGVGGQPPKGMFGAGGQPPFGFMGAGGQPPKGALGAGGQPPKGALGAGGQPPLGFMGAGGQPPLGFMGAGGQPPLGFMGAGGRPPLGFMGAGGQPPKGALGAGGQPPLGFMGAGGQPPPGFMGAGGGPRPPMGFMGQPMGMMGGKPPGTGGPGARGLESDDYVTVVVELKGEKRDFVKGVGPVNYISHKWGKTAFFEDPNEIQWQFVPSSKLPTPMEQFNKGKRTLSGLKEKGPEDYLDLADTCLQVGLPDKCIEVLNELDNFVSHADTKKMIVPERARRALGAYALVKPILSADVTRADKAKTWKTKLGYPAMAVTKHYALVHNSEDPARDGVQRRLAALEDTFKTYYLLFALKGKALPAPSEKMVAILVDRPDTFTKQMHTFEASDLIADGFHARQENLAIFSPTRLDRASRNYEQVMREVYKQNSTELLKGDFPKMPREKEKLEQKVAEVARAQVLSLVEQALREESEIATATHEGAAQLLAETGVLPRNTNAPEWLRFGLASLFEMPKGPFPGKTITLVKQSFYPGAGGPNWAWRRYLDELLADRLISDVPAKEVLECMTDVYFRHAHEVAKTGTETEAHTAMAQARCMAWGVTFYFFTEKFDAFDAFLTDLANRPRDVELDHFAVMSALNRAFDLRLTGISPMRPVPTPEQIIWMGKEWLACMRKYPAPSVKLKLEDVDSNPVNPKGPGRPGFPGGGPGVPGFPGGGPGVPGFPGGAPGFPKQKM